MGTPYKIGISDCCFVALAVVDAIRGTNFCKKYKGIYKTERQSKRYMVKKGYKNLAETISGETGLLPKAPAMLSWGDIAIVAIDNVEHVAVCCGAQFIVKADTGQLVFSISDVTAGFGV